MGVPYYRGHVFVSPDLLVQYLPDGECVFLNLRTEEYFGLDEVGTRIWAILTHGQSVDEAHRQLLDEYAVDSDRLRQDLNELVHRFVQHGFIELRNQ
ncbi:MAG: PqqD family protein [Egibacteraceae bacterium]